MEYDIDLVRKLLVNTIDDENIIISSFYDSLDSGEQVDRYLKTVEELIKQANKTNSTGWGVISQTNTGEIVNIRDNYLTSFDWQLRIETFKENKKEINTKLRQMINSLKGRKFNIQDDDGNNYKIMVAFSNIQADLPVILNDEEVVTLFLHGTTTISDAKFLMTNDIEEYYLYNEDLAKYRVYPVSNFSDYGVSGKDENTPQLKYRSEKRIQSVGNQFKMTFYVDVNNPIIMKLWEIGKYGSQTPDTLNVSTQTMTPNEYYYIEEVLNGWKYTTKHKLVGISPSETTGGLVTIECVFQMQQFISKEQL